MQKIQEQTVVSEKTTPTQVTRTTTVADQTVEQTPHEYKKKKAIFKTYQVIWYLLGLIEVLLAFRVLLKLMGASLGSPFVSFIYNISHPFAYPFLGMIRTSVVPEEGFVLEWSTIIAMLVYAAIAYGIIYFIQLMKPTTPEEVEQAVKEV